MRFLSDMSAGFVGLYDAVCSLKKPQRPSQSSCVRTECRCSSFTHSESSLVALYIYFGTSA